MPMRTYGRAILLILAWAIFLFGIHFATFALIPATRGPTVRVSNAVLHVAENALGQNFLTESNPVVEYPSGSLHANADGQKILILFWLVAYLLVVALVYVVIAWLGRSRARPEPTP